MKVLRFLAIFLSAVFVLAAAADAATIRITQPKLKSLGITISKFGIVNISKDGKIVTGYEKVIDTKLKQKGTVYKLWVFDFSGKTRESVKTSEILLPCTAIQNAALSHDGKTCIVTAERGSKFIKVDIPAKKATVLFEHKKGTPGFRCDSGVIQTFPSGKIAASGYFYDKLDQIKAKYIAYIDYTKTGADIFKPAFDTTRFEFAIGDVADYVEWVDAGKCFWIGKMKKTGKPELDNCFDENNKVLCYWDKGKATIIDHAPYFIHESAGRDHIIYTKAQTLLPRKEGELNKYEGTETYVSDINKKKFKVNPNERMYQYLTMSKDGTTAIMSDSNLEAATVSYFYGRNVTSYKMRPIKEQTRVQLNQLRLAESGCAYVTWDGFQITWGDLP
ncbi:MAG: hypothetical protein MJ234_05390 [bacterium]|nr:hypothetical protein [bacterium]